MGQLPSGTVTFLFSDIEGSTRLLREARGRYSELRDAHHRLLREAFAAADGHEMGTEGDAFFVAFRRAKDAVQAAVAAQRALAAYPWPEGAVVRVRMGIHTGEPEVDEEGYLGLALHQVARISAAAHGGQVLISKTTRDIVEDDLPGDVGLRDLGEQRLKDFDRPQRITQLEIDGLPAQFPPLRTAAPPSRLERLVRREWARSGPRGPLSEHPWYLRRRRLLLSALVGAIAAAVSIPVFAIGGGDSNPGVGGGASGLALIDPGRNEVVESKPIALRPRDVVADGHGLWVASLEPSTVLHLDPGTGKLRREISVATPPTSLAAGLGGVWALGTNPSRSGATLQRIDPAYDTSTEHVELAGLARGNEGGGVAAGEGAVWVAPGGVDPVLQLDPKSLAVVRRIDPVTCCPSGVAVGLGAVWVIDRVSGQVVRVDPGTGLSKTTTVGDGPSAVAVGERAVWVANGDDGTVSRIDPRNAAVTTTIGVGRSPSAVATGGGSVWVANSKDGTVTRIDPDTNAPVRTIPVGGSPQRLAYAYGKLWVSVEQKAGEATVADEAVSFRSESGPDTLDPALGYTPMQRSSLKGSTSLSWQIEYATCAKLVNYPDRRGPVGTQLVPEVAAALPKLSDRGRKYTFTIRKGFRFSPPSGAPVTAQTVRYSIERALSPRLAGPARRGRVAPLHGRGVLDDVVGAEAFESGRAKHIRGLAASGNKLIFTLKAPAPDLLARLAMPFFCVVPQNTPVAEGVRTVPAAGPYYVKSFVPDQKIVLERNPNYQGSRPHQLKEIEITLGEPRAQTVAQIENARVDYSLDGVPTAAAARLNERYGPGSAAARAGKQQFFVNPTLQNFYLALNTSRRPFSDVKRRRAVNYVIDRRVLAVLLTRFGISARATDQHLPPPMPGFRNTSVYPSIADPQKALRLSRKRVKAVLYSCGACGDADQVLQTYLATIGIELEVKRFPITTLTEKVGKRGEPFDVTFAAWSTEYLDPAAFLDVLLNGNHIRATQNFNISYFNNPSYNRKLEKAAKLNGRARYDAYGKLDVELARKAAPMAPLVNLTRQDFFSARMGCQIYNPLYGMDIAALCVRK